MVLSVPCFPKKVSHIFIILSLRATPFKKYNFNGLVQLNLWEDHIFSHYANIRWCNYKLLIWLLKLANLIYPSENIKRFNTIRTIKFFFYLTFIIGQIFGQYIIEVVINSRNKYLMVQKIYIVWKNFRKVVA